MPAAQRKPSNSQSQKPEPVVITAAEIFSDGVIDLVASADPCRPNLIFWNGDRALIAPRIWHAGWWYEGPVLHPTIARHVRFPHSADTSGSAVELFSTVADWLQEYFALSPSLADQIALWQASTWLSDRLPSPPALIITGPSMGRAVDLFKMLACGCRRALSLTGVNRAALHGLPPDLNLAFLINQPDIPTRLLQLLSAANHRGINVLGRAGAVQDWAGSKALFVGSGLPPSAWSGEALWISLPPAGTDSPPLDDQTLARIAQTLQSKFLGFRLKWLLETRAAAFSGDTVSFPGSELAQSLFACVRHEPELVQTTLSLLRGLVEEEAERRSLDPKFVILEVLWELAHYGRDLSVTEIAELLSVRLRTRGSQHEYSPVEVGWILSHYGFDRPRNKHGKLGTFSGENTSLLHRLVRTLGLNLEKVQGCSHCTGSEPVVTASVQGV